MKRLLIAFFLIIICCLQSSSQTFTIVEASQIVNDLSAVAEPRNDLNGAICGLVKVRCVLDDISFRGNIIGEVKNKSGEYWLYLSQGTKLLSLFHAKLLPLSVDLTQLYSEPIKSGCTYSLVLSIPDALYNYMLQNSGSSQEIQSTNSQQTTNQNHSTNQQTNNNSHVSNQVNKTLKGTIIDKKREEIIGCVIMVERSNKAVLSDIDGHFTLSDLQPDDVLVFSFIGYKTKKLTLSGGVPPQIEVILKEGKGTERETYHYVH